MESISQTIVVKPEWGGWNRRICSFPDGISSSVSEIMSTLLYLPQLQQTSVQL